MNSEITLPLFRSLTRVVLVSLFVSLVSCWPLFVALHGWPTYYFTNIVTILPCSFSLLLAPAIALGCGIELLRRGWNARAFTALFLSGFGVAAWTWFFIVITR